MTLEQKIRDVLARLSTLSEAPTASPSDAAPPADLPRSQRTNDRIGTKPQKKHHESMIPPGVSLKPTDPSKPPQKERSLFDFYVWKFTNTDPDDRAELFNLWLLAERDYHARVLHIPRRVAIRSGEDAKGAVSGVEAENEAAKRVVEIYEGMSAEEAAVFEYTTKEVICKARKMHRRNIDDGRPRPPFLEWDEDERRRQINLLKGRERDQGREIGAKSLGKHFGVDAKTIRKYTQLSPVG